MFGIDEQIVETLLYNAMDPINWNSLEAGLLHLDLMIFLDINT